MLDINDSNFYRVRDYKHQLIRDQASCFLCEIWSSVTGGLGLQVLQDVIPSSVVMFLHRFPQAAQSYPLLFLLNLQKHLVRDFLDRVILVVNLYRLYIRLLQIKVSGHFTVKVIRNKIFGHNSQLAII